MTKFNTKTQSTSLFLSMKMNLRDIIRTAQMSASQISQASDIHDFSDKFLNTSVVSLYLPEALNEEN